MKIFVAIPVYDGKLQVQTVKCLLDETKIAQAVGDEIQVAFLPSCSVPAQGRNQLVQFFLESDCEKMVFLDADLTFEPGSLLKLAHHKQDFVGGAYRYKKSQECYPITWLPDPDKKGLWLDSEGLCEVAMLPTGFLALTRSVFEKFRKAYPGREYDHWGHKAYAYFEMVFKDGALYSDDSYFCKLWRDSGEKIYLDPDIALAHWDFNPTPYSGKIYDWVKELDKPKQDPIVRMNEELAKLQTT